MSLDKEYVKKSKTTSFCSVCGAKILPNKNFCFDCGLPELPEKAPEETGISLFQAIIRIGLLGFLFLCVVIIKFDSYFEDFISSLDFNLESPLLKKRKNIQGGGFDLTHTVIPALANVRSKPSIDGHVIAVVEKGMNLILIEQKNDWAKVRVFNKTGWIASRLIKSEVQSIN
jgi:hypothetical protein